MRGALVLSSLPCLLAMVSIEPSRNYENRDVSRFYFEVHEMIVGEDVVLDWHFNSPTRRNFQFFCRVTNYNQSVFYYTYDNLYYLGTYEGVFSSRVTIPAEYIPNKYIYLMFGTKSLDRFDDWGDTVYFRGTAGTAINSYNNADSKKIETGRSWAYDDIYGVYYPTTYYQLKKRAYLPIYNTLGIDLWQVGYFDSEDGVLDYTYDSAELRILNNFEQWGIGTRVKENDIEYIRIPLVLEDLGDGMYGFKTKYTYLYDRRTGVMTNYSYGYDKNIACATRNVILPENRKKSGVPYQYEILLNGANGIDNIGLSGETEEKSIHFGNCNEADYCVVIGGE